MPGTAQRVACRRKEIPSRSENESHAFLEISLCISSVVLCHLHWAVAFGNYRGVPCIRLFYPISCMSVHPTPFHPLPNASSSLKKTWMLLHVSPSCQNRQIRMNCSQAMTWELLQLYSNSLLPGSDSLLVLLTWNFVNSSQATSP